MKPLLVPAWGSELPDCLPTVGVVGLLFGEANTESTANFPRTSINTTSRGVNILYTVKVNEGGRCILSPKGGCSHRDRSAAVRLPERAGENQRLDLLEVFGDRRLAQTHVFSKFLVGDLPRDLVVPVVDRELQDLVLAVGK